MFVDRQRELAFLHNLLQRQRPGPAQFVLLYGRRRVGKTTLLRHWVEESGLPHIYWVAEKEPSALQRRKLYAKLQNIPIHQSPVFDSWGELWAAVANLVGDQRYILILDELPYAAESDPAMVSALQQAWDHIFKDRNMVIVLCGSQVRTMEALQSYQAPLYGRFTGQWHLQPLPFYSLTEFFPNWSIEERIAVYAIVGGIPAYLEWLDPSLSLVENIRQVILSPGGLFLAEPMFLLYDEVYELQSYLAILKAIGAGCHTLSEISNHCLIGKTHLSSYLVRLQDLKMIERRLPATVPLAQQAKSRRGHYHLLDPYFRFYFRFLSPFHDVLAFDTTPVIDKVRQELLAFVGQTLFAELSQLWVRLQGRQGHLPFVPDVIGSHWSRQTQVDVVAINWNSHDILVGECRWEETAVNQQVVHDLIERKTPHLLNDLPNGGTGWKVHYAFFARSGFAEAAVAEMITYGGVTVDLSSLVEVLRQV